MIDHTRHIGIFNASHLSVCLIGVGGIGAITGVTLGKMGVQQIDAFDDDVVDGVNVATQFYGPSDVGSPKGQAFVDNVLHFCDSNVSAWEERVNGDTTLPYADIYISSVDSIASRQDIWQAIKKAFHSKYWFRQDPPPVSWYIDARMGAEVYEQFVVHIGKDYEWYQKYVMGESDDDFPEVPCTEKATIYTANIAAGHIGAAVRRIATNKQEPGLLRHDILNNSISFLEMT